jgi:hypothetical protein
VSGNVRRKGPGDDKEWSSGRAIDLADGSRSADRSHTLKPHTEATRCRPASDALIEVSQITVSQIPVSQIEAFQTEVLKLRFRKLSSLGRAVPISIKRISMR